MAPSSSLPIRILWLAAGWFFFAVGVVGLALPGLPTTGPMLLALACFSRGSTRLHTWLYTHRIFGPPLQRWQRERTIPIQAKIAALSMMLVSAGITLFTSMPLWAEVAILGLVIIGMVVVVRIPHSRGQISSNNQP